MDPASAAAAATFRIVGAAVDTVTLLSRAYGGTVAGDIILTAAQVLGQLGRGGRAAVPTPAHVHRPGPRELDRSRYIRLPAFPNVRSLNPPI